MDYYQTERPSGFGVQFNGGLTPVVKGLLIVNISIFVVQMIVGDWFTILFGLSSAGIRHGYIWQFFTYMFLHSTVRIFHIIFNMLMLFMLGPETERGLGSRNFLVVYLLSGLLGGVMWVVLGYQSLCIGASGAIYGMMGAFAALWPNRKLTLLLFFVFPITVKAWVMVCGLAGIELLSSVSNLGGGVAHLVHLVGVIVGVGFTWWKLHGNGLGSLFQKKSRLRVVRGGGQRGNSSGYYERSMPVDPELVDRLLDKIANQGMGSLTQGERDILEAASRQRKR